MSSEKPASIRPRIQEPVRRNSLRLVCLTLLFVAIATVNPPRTHAQGDYAIWGEVKIERGDSDTKAPSGFTIILYKDGGSEVGRQTVSSGGRYRFTELAGGDYDVVVEADNVEIARSRLTILQSALAPFYGFRQDFDFNWKAKTTALNPKGISAADLYTRSSANQALFNKAQQATAAKKYEDAVRFLQSILDKDKADFQVWSLLGTIYLLQEKMQDAENAYLSAIELKPTFAQAQLNLGRLRSSQKHFAEAIDPLTRALESQPQSGEINLLLGEAYLQVKKGSKAIPYLDEAARQGRPEAHLRLAWLYNAAGIKDKAAIEYEEFLKKKPDYPERKKLEEYISTHKKS